MKKQAILVSACLLGVCCRYDGESKPDAKVIKLREKYVLIPICPEVDGGLPTPRTPSERVGDKVIMKDGKDVTANYRKGAEEAFLLCELLGIKKALLKEKSPSCGKGEIYDGSFSGTLTVGNGVTSELLHSRGIAVFGESETDKLL